MLDLLCTGLLLGFALFLTLAASIQLIIVHSRRQDIDYHESDIKPCGKIPTVLMSCPIPFLTLFVNCPALIVHSVSAFALAYLSNLSAWPQNCNFELLRMLLNCILVLVIQAHVLSLVAATRRSKKNGTNAKRRLLMGTTGAQIG